MQRKIVPAAAGLSVEALALALALAMAAARRQLDMPGALPAVRATLDGQIDRRITGVVQLQLQAMSGRDQAHLWLSLSQRAAQLAMKAVRPQ